MTKIFFALSDIMQTNPIYTQTSKNLPCVQPNSPYLHDIFVVTKYDFIYGNALVICEEIVPLTVESAINLLSNSDDENNIVNSFYYIHPFTMKIYKVMLVFQCVTQVSGFSKIDQEHIKSCLTQLFSSKNSGENYFKVKCKWEEESIKVLLFYLTENKEDVLLLECRGSKAGKVRMSLWNGAVTALLNKGYTYTAEQCATKWKNIKQNHDVEACNNIISSNLDINEIMSKDFNAFTNEIPVIANERWLNATKYLGMDTRNVSMLGVNNII
ncbi:11774_t:CDS:2 [Funneliformis mosseae]|uniref:11774_t:CDS:1 n=1 Tax=Funneliformis mosseae TaxID=27381 RepID=A0A9N9CML7_FUNMO|nr:11774_t:CDS:2 [Funneliformis mosseae]